MANSKRPTPNSPGSPTAPPPCSTPATSTSTATSATEEDGATHRNLRTFTGSIVEDEQLLRDLCAEGLAYRYPDPDEAILERMEYEIEVLREEFLAYFLVNWDITSYARSKGYFHVGRERRGQQPRRLPPPHHRRRPD